jgi:hypothetical protein
LKTAKLAPIGLSDQEYFIWTASNQVGSLKINYTNNSILASIKWIKAHKNKYSTSGAKLSPTFSMV